MKKRLLSIVLALALALSLVPVGWASSASQNDDVVYLPVECGNYRGQRSDGVFIFDITIPDNREDQPYPITSEGKKSFYGQMEISDTTVVYHRSHYFYGCKPGTADVSYSVSKNYGGPYVLKAIVHVTVIPTAEYKAAGGKEAFIDPNAVPIDTPTNPAPETSNPETSTPPNTNTGTNANTGTNTNTGNNSNTGTSSVINPKFGRYLGTNEYGVYLFDITIPDDGTRQPLPFLNMTHITSVGVEHSTFTKYEHTGENEGKLYGVKPGKGYYTLSGYVGGTPGGYDGVECSAYADVTVIPAAEYYGTGTTPGSGDTERPHAHRYADEITKRPTASQPGVRTYTCTICGDTYTEPIPATGVVTTGTPITKTPATEPAKSSNYGDQHSYGNWADTVKSYLYENERGGLTRVEYAGSKIVVEDYDSTLHFLSGWTTQPELPVWGGFYAGADYNFMVFGQNNREENPSKEVIRVVQYTKDWQRVNSVSLYGANTTEPFNAGSLRCTEHNGFLYIRTCHTMFKSPDGLNHQANVMLSIQQSDMSIADAHYIVGNSGYVSHSFNQFVLVDKSGQLVTLDHGDAYPRALVLYQYAADMVNGQFTKSKTQEAKIVSFPGAVGDNTTGCAVGGLEETSNGYVAAYQYDSVAKAQSDNINRDIYLGFVRKGQTAPTTYKVNTSGNPRTPQIVSTGANGGYVLWNLRYNYIDKESPQNKMFYYASYDTNGKPGEVKSVSDVYLSDCKPILYNGKVVWYVTTASAPVFYILDSSGITSVNTAPAKEETPGTSTQQPGSNTQQPGTGKQTFSDVPVGAFFTEPVAWAVEKEVTNGTTTTTFSPYEECTQVQILTFLWRAAGKPASDTALPINITGKNIDYAEGALRWAAENKMIDRSFVPNTPCTRASAVTYIWQAFGSPEEVVWSASDGWGGSNFTDVPANSILADAISWAVAEEVTNGTSKTTFSPNDICNRGQIVTFLYRAYH